MVKCLVIDDVKVTRYTAETFLEELGVSVVSVENAERAKDVLSRDRFDFILLDWHLRGDSGLDFLREIREKSSAKVPVIVFSGVEGQAKASEAISAGANAFLEKPTTKENLSRCIGNIGIKLSNP